MEIPIFQIDAFSDQPFSGNPAAICPLQEWLPDEILQKIAEELGGTVVYVTCSDKTTTHQKIVIDYGHQKKTK